MLVEEEETVQDGAAGVPKAEPSTAGKERFTDMRAGTRNEPQPKMAMLFVHASVCNFNHPHSKSSFQGQAGSSAASQPPSLTAVLLSRHHLSHTPVNQGVAWPVRSLVQAIQRLVKEKRTKIGEN